MLKNENIICISSIDWDFIWQGHQEIMATLAKGNNRILFIENTGVRMPGIRDFSRIKKRFQNWFRGIKGIRKEMENLYVFSPLVLPFPYFRIARWINRHLVLSILNKWIRAVNFNAPIIWTFLPTPLSKDIINNINNKLVIYYCIDSFSASSVSAKKIKRSEIGLLQGADLVFVTSKALQAYCLKYNPRVHYFPFAVNFKEFENIRKQQIPLPDDLKNIKPPIVGYIGGVHRWVDQGLVRDIATERRERSFVFIGPIQTDVSLLSGLPNIYFLGNKNHNELPCYIKHLDVCIIPYLMTEYTENVYPTKLNEYLAMGKPVISAALPEIIRFNEDNSNIVYVAKDSEDFIRFIEIAMAENTDYLAQRRIAVASKNSWPSRIEQMSLLINDRISLKNIDVDARWRENLAFFYRVARKRILRFTAVIFAVYLLLFQTPLIWFVAYPLKIIDVPRKADAIVVFGGGVGETGSPGNSTIERARYASQLYNNGYAQKVIFSTGYTYIYNDAENMRLVALSVGVSDNDIILEEKANSAYENVIFSKSILEKHRWDSILLVSSPYNMRRLSLMFNKHCKNIKVFYLPVARSKFYDRKYGRRSEQMKAILHEYASILYYWVIGRL